MPELPEVETIRRGLQTRIVGKTIADIDVRFPKTFIGDKLKVESYKVKSVERRAKVLAICMNNSYNLLFHLKMTGQLIWHSPNEISKSEFLIPASPAGGSKQIPNPKTKNPNKFSNFAGGHPDHNWHANLPNNTTAVIFTFDDNSRLYFNDLRKFGWCKVLTDEQLQKIFTEEYGPEPLDISRGKPSEKFNVEYLMQQAARFPNRKVKQFLMDQGIIAGIGNIYADESLFDAKISPLRKAKDITKTEWQKIMQSVKKILETAIKYGGTTDSDYVNVDGEKGGMQNHLKVYRKAGQKCPRCGGIIIRIVLGGRGTHYCPICQQ